MKIQIEITDEQAEMLQAFYDLQHGGVTLQEVLTKATEREVGKALKMAGVLTTTTAQGKQALQAEVTKVNDRKKEKEAKQEEELEKKPSKADKKAK